METVEINQKNYQFITNYKHNDILRNSFHSLTQKIYHFDFEQWYKSGYWSDTCMLYSLLHDNTVISHITVNIIDFVILGERKRFVQLGTVMTDEYYRNQGLSGFLIQKVMEEWNNKCDIIYLFANDSVLNYYPKFGFTAVSEYQAIKKITKSYSPYSFRKLNLDNKCDIELLHKTAKNNFPQSKISMVNNVGLVMFYCNYFELFSFRENLYLIQSLNAIAVAEYEDDTLIIYDILSPQKINIEEVISVLSTDKTSFVILRFMPSNCENYEISIYKEDDSTLFVTSAKSSIFEDNKLIFPILSHT